jgi:hypothetical protein
LAAFLQAEKESLTPCQARGDGYEDGSISHLAAESGHSAIDPDVVVEPYRFGPQTRMIARLTV